MVQDELQEAMRLPATMVDYSSLVEPGSVSVSIPRLAHGVALTKSEGTEVVSANLAMAADAISFTHKYVSYDVEDIAKLQSKVALMSALTGRIGVALADAIDTLCYDQIKLGSASAPDHLIDYTDGTNNDLQVEDFSAVVKLLEIQKVAKSERFLLIPPTQLANLLKIDTFVEADKFGSRESLLNGFFGRLFGFDVLVSNVAESDNYSIFYHKTHAAGAFQSPVKMEINRNPKNISDIMIGHVLFGAKVLDAGVRGVRVYPAA